MIQIGQKAPDFTLPDQMGKNHSLANYKGAWVIVYFYPKDDTPGCTIEACKFRDAKSVYEKNHVVVLGISKDTVDSHKKFSEKFQLPFPILSDVNHVVIEQYGAWAPKKFMGKEFLGILRKTILIDPKGMIRKIYDKVDVNEHADQIIEDIQSFTKK